MPAIDIDLDGVVFLDSTGLGMFVSVLKRLRSNGADSHVVCNPPRVRKVFGVTALDRLLPIYESVGAAVAGVAKRPHLGT